MIQKSIKTSTIQSLIKLQSSNRPNFFPFKVVLNPSFKIKSHKSDLKAKEGNLFSYWVHKALYISQNKIPKEVDIARLSLRLFL